MMKAWQWIVVAAALLPVSGCKVDPNITLLERELRLQEDKIYQMNEAIEDQQAVVDSCRRENATLRKQLACVSDIADGFGEMSTPSGTSKSASAAKASGPSGETILLKPPRVELPPLKPPEVQLPEKPQSSTRSHTPPAAPDSGPVLPGMSAPDETDAPVGIIPAGLTPTVSKGESKQVAKIALNQLITGGYNTSGKSGHDGVMVCIEPRDAQGQLIEAPADVSVVVLDPAQQGQAARVARWDFTAKEIAGRFRKTPIASGIQLEMPWPADPPAHNDLHLFVRYTTADGRKLEADKTFKVALAGESVARAALPEVVQPAVPVETTLQSSRSDDSWRASRSPVPRAVEIAPIRVAARPSDSAPRAADAPISPTAGLPEGAKKNAESKIQRPVWSPNRQ
jgi:hypothetical protein